MAEKYTYQDKVFNHIGLFIGIVAFILIMLHLIIGGLSNNNDDIYITRTICENNWCERIEVNELRFYNEYIVDCDDDPKTINCLEEGCCHYEKRVRQTFQKNEIDKIILNNQCECAYRCYVDETNREDCTYCNKYICGDNNVEIN